MMTNLTILILIWNIFVFFVFMTDKVRAKKNLWRISEKVLIACSFMLGGIGALAGMEIFHHKTKKLKFKVLIPFSFVITKIIIFYLTVKEGI